MRSIAAGALLAGAPVLAPSAVAQVGVSPAAVEASLPAGEQSEVEVVVTNEGTAPVNLFAVPLPEEGVPEDVGELLFSTKQGEAHYPYGMTMTPDGRLFVASDALNSTREYTPELEYLRLFEHPQTDRTSGTKGLAWMPPEDAPPGHPKGTLWWMDIVVDCDGPNCTVESTLLIEGDLDGDATGRTVELITGPGIPGPISYDRGVPGKLAYDAEGAGGAGLFYYLDGLNDALYAIDVEGEVADGYPVEVFDLDPEVENEVITAGLDASRGADGGRYLDVGVVLPGEEYGEARIAVTDRRGRATGAETPLTRIEPPDGQGEFVRAMGVLRSRLAPSVMYLTIRTQHENDAPPWVVAVRAHPLPPRWLRVAPVAPLSLEIAPGETDTLTVRLDAEDMVPGVYAGQVALREGDPNGEEATSVPVVLTVTPGTDAGDEAEPEEASRLAVYPNPAYGSATVALMLAESAEVRVTVYDVLGREVATLTEGRFEAGTHRLALDASGLPAGVYVIRATVGDSRVFTQRLTVLR